MRTKLRSARGGKRGRPKKTATECDEDDASDMDEKKPKETCKNNKNKRRGYGPKHVKTKPKSKAKKVKHDGTEKKPSEGPELAERSFGCSRCRWASKGCRTCEDPMFKPRGPRKPKK